MASIYQQTTSRPLPKSAKVTEKDGKEIASWKGHHGRIRKAPVTKTGRISDKATTFSCEYTDANGISHTVATGCRNKDAAEAFLQKTLDREKRKRSGVLSADEEKAADAASTPLSEHVDAHIEWLLRTNKTPGHASTRRSYLLNLIAENGWSRLSHMTRDGLERAMKTAQDNGRSARTANAIRESALAFANWILKQKQIMVNPFTGVAKMNQAADPRRQRRTFSMDETRRLLAATEARPLHDARMKNRGKDQAKLSENTVTHLRDLGRERRLAYLVMLLTGLRLGELRAVRICDVVLDSDYPHINLRASITKNRKEADVPLRKELAAELRAWMEDRYQQSHKVKTTPQLPAIGKVSNHANPQESLLFQLPEKMTRVFDRDLAFAGIPKRDCRNRTVDIHCLRHTFCTWLTESGTPLQTAQRLMRHSEPKLTAAVYTHHTNKTLQSAISQLPVIEPNEVAGQC